MNFLTNSVIRTTNKQGKRKIETTTAMALGTQKKPIHLSPITFNSPELLEIQRSAFYYFIKQGITEELTKKFPIKVKNGNYTIELLLNEQNFKLTSPEDTPRECVLKMKTYSCKLYVQVELIWKKLSGKIVHKTKPEWILFGQLPIMTKRGHFIINGSPRVIVHQVVRSPGIYFQKLLKKDDKNKARFYGDIIPFKGVWVRLQMTKKGRVEVRFKKGKKVQVELLIKCLQVIENQHPLSLDQATNTEILPHLCFSRQSNQICKSKVVEYLYSNRSRSSPSQPLISLERERLNSLHNSLNKQLVVNSFGLKSVEKRRTAAESRTEHDAFVQTYDKLYRTAEDKELEKWQKKKRNQKLVKNISRFGKPNSTEQLVSGLSVQGSSSNGTKLSFVKSWGEGVRKNRNTASMPQGQSANKAMPLQMQSFALQENLYGPDKTKISEESDSVAKALQGASHKKSSALFYRSLICNAKQSKANKQFLGDKNLKAKAIEKSRATLSVTEKSFKRKKCFENLFATFKISSRYDLSELGREKINAKFDLIVKDKQLSALDLNAASSWLTLLRKGEKNVDDIDHSQNRRVRTSGELLQTQFENGLDRLKNLLLQKLKELNNTLSASTTPLQINVHERAIDFRYSPYDFPNRLSIQKKFVTQQRPAFASFRPKGMPKPDFVRSSLPSSLPKRRTHQFTRQTDEKKMLTKVFTKQSFSLKSWSCKARPSKKAFALTRSSKNEQSLKALRTSESKVLLHGLYSLYSFSISSPLPAQQSLRSLVRMPVVALGRFGRVPSFFSSARKKQLNSKKRETCLRPMLQGFAQKTLSKNAPWSCKLRPVLTKKESALRHGTKVSVSINVKELFSAKPVTGALREFFGSNPLSQYMDQTNPLAEITHKRRMSSLGLGGVSRESAGMAIRGIHPTHYGRICPIETPEGKNAGLVNSLAFYTKVNKDGFLETPYYQVFKGQIQSELGFMFCSARKESEAGLHIAPNDLQQSLTHVLRTDISKLDSVPIRVADNLLDVFKKIKPEHVQCIGISPIQMISVATSLIPFLEHNDANRALMGSNMQRQAVPLMISEKPIVGTGLESLVLVESGHVTQSELSGFVSNASANQIVVEQMLPKRFQHNFLPSPPFPWSCKARPALTAMHLKSVFSSLSCVSVSYAFKAHRQLRLRVCKEQRQIENRKCKKRKQFEKSCFSRAKLVQSKALQIHLPAKQSFASKATLSTVSLARRCDAKLTHQDVTSFAMECNSTHFYTTSDQALWNLSYPFIREKKVKHLYFKAKPATDLVKQQADVVANLKTRQIPLKTPGRHKTLSCKSSLLPPSNSFSKPKTRQTLYQLNTGSTLCKRSVHALQTFSRSNQNTCITEKPLVHESDWVQKGDILSDCSASDQGELSVGKNVVIAYIPWEGYNFEDAIVISDRLVKEHVYTSLHIERYVFQAQDTKNGDECFTKKLPGVENKLVYHLEESGLPKIGSFLKEGDILVGKVKYLNKKPTSPYERLLCDILGEKNFSARNKSFYMPKGVEARVINYRIVNFFQSESENKLRPVGSVKTVHIFLGERRVIQVGDKMSGRHGNKGVISTILPMQDMPYLPDGTSIDLILNPLGVPSRMNVGQVLECLLGLASSYLNQHFKMACFDELYGIEASQSLVYLKLYQARLQTGQNWLFHVNFPGKTRVFDGRTGECFDQWITVGRAYILKLIHMVSEKIHARSTGPYALITQQPLRGRSNKGGQRLGEMEVWALQGFGAAYTLQELLTKKSDDFFGRKELVDSILPSPSSIKDTIKPDIRIEEKKEILGHPEIFKVLLCELQALCLDVGVYILTTESFQRSFLGVVS